MRIDPIRLGFADEGIESLHPFAFEHYLPGCPVIPAT
jgi:hypothetical protein